MLIRLQIQNFALITDIALDFHPQLNVLTGETGAGKSILIDALCFALGERYDGQKPAAGKPCSVEAVFDLAKKIKAQEIISQFVSEEDDVLILHRVMTADGRNRVWINNRAATNASLKEVGNFLIDIHGQHDHQQLFDAASHLELIDRLAKLESVREDYEKIYQEYALIVRNKEELQNLQQSRDREIDLLKYQIKEIEGPQFEDGEEIELKTERIRLANSEKLHAAAERLLQFLNEDETNVSSLLGRSAKELQSLVRLDASLENLKGDFDNAQLAIEEIIRTVKDYQENLFFDEDRLEEIDKRMDQIELVKRKYGGSLQEALRYLAEAKSKYDKLINSELYGKEMDQKISKLLPKLKSLAADLTEKRKKTAISLKRTIEMELKDLNIPNAQFECKIEKKDFAADGVDQIEFLISLNAGQEVLPLRKIISGGEASRVMLAMKKALMKVDPVPTLIFDEIDANIGGRLGSVTGQKLKEISEERQVLLITHLPQIASFADRHFKVSKKSRSGQTVVEYSVIEGEERVRELAQMLGGKQESTISLKHAEEMLTRGKS